MSPYLFTLVMEVLTFMLKRRARDSNFSYHRYCSKLNIINLCFADDLFLFAHGDENSSRVIMDSLEEFKNASGLTPSLPKSTTYFCNVLNHVKLGILNVLLFERMKLLLNIGDVPLVFPLGFIVSNHDIYTIGFRLDSKAHKIIDHGSWSWPNDWASKCPSLVNITIPHLSNEVDCLTWRNLANVDSDFSVAKVWDCILPRSPLYRRHCVVMISILVTPRVSALVGCDTKNAGYGGNGNRNAGRQNRNQAFNAGNGNDDINQIVQRVPRTESTLGKANVQCYNCNEKGHYDYNCQKPRVRDAKYFREQMLLTMKNEAGRNLNDEENDFMLDNSYGEETMEELTTAVMLMARIQPADVSHVKCKTIIQTSDDDQIDSNIIFDDPYVENNGGTSEHDSNAHDEYHEIQMLAYNVQREAENQRRLNNELKKQKELLQKELETCEDQVKTFEAKTIQCSKYKETCEELERELWADKDTIERILKEKDKKIQSDFFKIENEKLIIQHETQLAKKDFKE
ncbi:retrovirus-related pol polyprotein from transposon TNT 1-94 [Tanacetum coccineum]